MAIVSAGYDGTVDETQFAKMLNRYSVVGADDFAANTIAGDRTVSIGNGTALGPGTVDVATDLPSIQFAAATGTRWDMVVLRRDWQPPGGSTTVQIIQGGSTAVLPSRQTNPGILDDQPIYLQQVNGNLLGERIDLRCWNSHSGLVAVHELTRTYMETPGARVVVNGTDWVYVRGANGTFSWTALSKPQTSVALWYGSGSTAYSSFPAPTLRETAPGYVRVEGMFKPGTSADASSLLAVPAGVAHLNPPATQNKKVAYRTTANSYGIAFAQLQTTGSIRFYGLPSNTDYVELGFGWFV